MPTRWVILIAGGVVVLAMILFLPPRGRMSAQMLGLTNEGAAYLLMVTNGTDSMNAFVAWVQYETEGDWKPQSPSMHSAMLAPGEAKTFTLDRPMPRAKRAIVVFGTIAQTKWDHWWRDTKALAGIYPKPKRLYVEVE